MGKTTGSGSEAGVRSQRSGPYSGQTAGSGSEAGGQESNVRAILGSDCRVRGRGQESTVRAIPRARVQGQGQRHKEGKKSRFRSQK